MSGGLGVLIAVTLSLICSIPVLSPALAFHIEFGSTDERADQDLREVIAFCNSTLDSNPPAELTDVNTCDAGMIGLFTMCQDSNHSSVLQSCSDPRINEYLTLRNLVGNSLDLKHLLSLFSEYGPGLEPD